MELPQLKQWEQANPEEVIPLLQTVADLLEKRCDRYLTQQYQLTSPQYLLLLAAVYQSDITLGDLSEKLNCSRGNVTGIVDRLERDGWLMRERSTEDRRVITVKLTEKGARVGDIKKDLTRELGKMSEVWNVSERQSLTDILVRLYKELKD